MKPSQSLIKAAVLLLTARAYCDVIRPEILAAQTAELAANPYYYSPKWGERLELTVETDRIFNPRHIIRSSDEEELLFLKRMDKRHFALGYKTESGQCPLGVGELLVMDLTRDFCDQSKELQVVVDPSIFGYFGKHYDEYVEACMKYVCSFISKGAPLIADVINV